MLPNKEEAPDDIALNVRLMFDAAKPKDIRLWTDALRKNGISILAVSNSGIDAKGNIANLETALDAKIEIAQDVQPSIGKINRVVAKTKVQPVAYIPRKPTFF